MDQKPLFRTLEECLWWAWYLAPARASTVKPPAIAGMIGRDSREQRDEQIVKVSSDAFMFERKPSGYDASAQAGMIKSYILGNRTDSTDRRRSQRLCLTRDEACHIMARFLKGRERARARRAMVGAVLSYIDESWNTRPLVLRLMAKHYGHPGIFLEDLAERYRVKGGRRAVTAINREVLITLDAIGFRAEAKVIEYLQENGVIQ